MINHMFYVPMMHFKSSWNKEIKDEVLSRLSKSRLFREENTNTNYSPLFYNNPEYKEFVVTCLREDLNNFAKDIEVPRDSLVVKDMWHETSEKNDCHIIHNHGAIGYSACWYVDFDFDEHLGTTFYSPFNNFLSGSVIPYRPLVAEGDVVFFPSSIMHEAQPNKSNKPRTVVSFNISIE
jgi:hypothetical protein